MAATESPRRILAERDINKPTSTRLPSNAASPTKLGFSTLNDTTDKTATDMAKRSQELVLKKIHDASSSSTSLKSPLGCRKRGVDCLTDIQNGPPRKQAVNALSNDGSDDVSPTSGHIELHGPQSRATEHNTSSTLTETRISTSMVLQRSMSPESSFDATQDSEILDSQLTNITEPEDLVAHGLPRITTAALSVPRVVSQEAARENAEALRLRLKFAMYKIKTNQTDLPLSLLEIRYSKSHNVARTLLPTSRLANMVTPTSHPSQSRDRNTDTEAEIEDPNSAPSSSPPQLVSPVRSHLYTHNTGQCDIATPILPRSRDGMSHLGSRGSPEPGPEVTSSVVKGRAADGLLSLMGGDVSCRS